MWELLLFSNDTLEYSSAKIIRMATFDNGNIIVDLSNWSSIDLQLIFKIYL